MCPAGADFLCFRYVAETSFPIVLSTRGILGSIGFRPRLLPVFKPHGFFFFAVTHFFLQNSYSEG
jgi:hypothetical protein